MNKTYGILVAVLITISFVLAIGCQNPPGQYQGGNQGQGGQTQSCVSNQQRMVGVDMPGNDREMRVVNNVDQCYQACCGESWCMAYSFVPSNGQCWLKDAIPAQVNNPNVTSLAVRQYVINPWFPIQPVQACVNQPRSQTGLQGGNVYNYTSTQDAGACYQACCSDTNCMGYMFDQRDHSCRLFSGNPQFWMNTGNPMDPLTTIWMTSGRPR